MAKFYFSCRPLSTSVHVDRLSCCVDTPACLFKLGECGPKSTAVNQLTMDKYIIQPHSK